MACITERMKVLAMLLEAEAIDAGFEYAKTSWESAEWNGEKQSLRVFGVDSKHRSHLWKKGEEHGNDG